MTEFSDYIVYVDESGDANWKAAPEYPLLCVNYCLFKKDYYLNTLIPKFKSKYEGLKGERRKVFMEEMSALMDEAEFLCFSVIIDKPDVPKKFRVYDPYHISLSRGFRQIYDYLQANHPNELKKELHIVFEKRGRDDDMSLSKAYQQITLQGALLGTSSQHDFSNFRLELMDKKGNSTGLQIADLTARPIGNHYLQSVGKRQSTDQRAIEILLDKLRYCANGTCEKGTYDVFHTNLP